MRFWAITWAMESVGARMLVVVACLLAFASEASADTVTPRSAAAFRGSVGVQTHIVYYDTAYGNWPRAVEALRALGVRHLRDGVYANPARSWRDWNERYAHAVELAAAAGMRFDFGMGRPGSETGTLDQLVELVGGRLRPAAEALEAPNEFDRAGFGRRWPALLRGYLRSLAAKAGASPALRGLPLVGPSLVAPEAPRTLGDQRASLDVGNIHPYTGGTSPSLAHLRSELARMRAVSGDRPVWATEAGFHTALGARTGQPPVSERAGAVYLLRTFLEHFAAGIERTYAYELVDEKPDPAGSEPEWHFGLLRNDFSPKPAFTALRNLLALVGPEEGSAPARPLALTVTGGSDVRRLVLRKADGTYVVALWRSASVWDRDGRRALEVSPARLRVALPGAVRVTRADPLASAVQRVLRIDEGRVGLTLAGDPVLLQVTLGRG